MGPMRVFGPIIVTVLLGPLMITLAASDGQERIVSTRDADRIFGLTRSQWEAEVREMVHSQHWKVQVSPATGTGVMALDPKTGVGLAVQPLFRNAQGPPEMLVVGSYYPAGTFRQPSEQTKRDMEAAVSSDLGPAYSVSVSFRTMASPPPGSDVVEVIITRAQR
jgi:hypothetical protein